MASQEKKQTGRLPGDLTPSEIIKQMIRVDHAGEYGAKRIYQGQIAVTKNEETRKILEHMAEQEQEHLDYFDNAVKSRRVRPTLLMPLWHVAGYALGAGTALLGEKAAMACTVAVETVIDEHYQEQLEQLGDSEPELKETIERFRQEELEHKEIGLEHDAELAPGYEVLSAVVKGASKLAIFLSKRV